MGQRHGRHLLLMAAGAVLPRLAVWPSQQPQRQTDMRAAPALRSPPARCCPAPAKLLPISKQNKQRNTQQHNSSAPSRGCGCPRWRSAACPAAAPAQRPSSAASRAAPAPAGSLRGGSGGGQRSTQHVTRLQRPAARRKVACVPSWHGQRPSLSSGLGRLGGRLEMPHCMLLAPLPPLVAVPGAAPCPARPPRCLF